MTILADVREALGIEETFTGFDNEILSSINSAVMTLNQIGVGPTTNLTVDDGTDWEALFDGRDDIQGLKKYVELHSRRSFDPPATSYLQEAMSRQIQELEWRLQIQVEPDPVVEE